MSHHLITFDDISYEYDDGSFALEGISFQIHHGEKIGLLGANGAGKSTLIGALSGFIPVTHGAIFIGNLKVCESSLNTVRRTLGVVFQNPDDQLFMPTVYDDIAFGLKNLGVPDEDIDARVRAALVVVDGLNMIDKPPYRLSLGQKKRVAIAGVIAMEPHVLVLDEPTSSLDPIARENVIRIIKSFTHSQLIATHDLDMVLEVCDRVVVLKEGKLVCSTRPAELFSDEKALREFGLTLPLSMKPVQCPGKPTLYRSNS
ncbi:MULTISPECIES: energy-coupling factor ABC transporter ATP-binding protein [Vibrio]|jgi:cobalt/nickel transport system ATP-binding protein|uniref:energy-coupling factor ABC transporter ATP-binding protein n=1 Tax=Vibrio TaxID=662 RepID=UPI000BFFA20F|nr:MULTISPECIES: ABC transporter ATP-binding protein [unclassified Vibrio]PHJ43284.1 cobalt ABC transporter ATP-binding protein [Vibrio sp. PID17_43]RIZ53749.1 cobalt ABC transporter ATP-binding protein [Vibrio sp. PID23_8]